MARDFLCKQKSGHLYFSTPWWPRSTTKLNSKTSNSIRTRICITIRVHAGTDSRFPWWVLPFRWKTWADCRRLIWKKAKTLLVVRHARLSYESYTIQKILKRKARLWIYSQQWLQHEWPSPIADQYSKCKIASEQYHISSNYSRLEAILRSINSEVIISQTRITAHRSSFRCRTNIMNVPMVGSCNAGALYSRSW